MPRQLPPLNALKAFEAAARSESFTRAAEELCVTQGAVSHQVKSLEDTLGIDLRVSATMHHIDFVREEVDVAVRHGDGNWSGLDAVRLCTEQLFPVCSPKLMSGRNRITKPSDLLKSPLLHLDDSKAWSQWFDAAGVADAETSHGLTLNRASMLIDAAVDGQGVALARTTLAAWDLINGRLTRPFDVGLKLSRTMDLRSPHVQ